MGVNTVIIQDVSGEGTAARFRAILIQLEPQSALGDLEPPSEDPPWFCCC